MNKALASIAATACLAFASLLAADGQSDVISPRATRIAAPLSPATTQEARNTPAVTLIYTIVIGAACFLTVRFWLGRNAAATKGANTAGLHIVQTRMIGQKLQLTVVEYDNRRLLLGVTQNSINLIDSQPDANRNASSDDETA